MIAACAWLALRAFPRIGAATRYGAWLVTLLAIVVIPVLSATRTQPATTTFIAPGTVGYTTSTTTTRTIDRPSGTVHETSGASATRPFVVDTGFLATQASAPFVFSERFAFAMALLWLLAAARRFGMLAFDHLRLARIARRATPWPMAAAFPVVLSNTLKIPCAMGVRRGIVVLPSSFFAELEPAAIEAIVEHEIAHIRRGDLRTNLVARIVEALFPLKPGLHFVMGRLALEREIACDDWVVARRGSGDGFARTLARLASLVCEREPIAAPSVLGSRNALLVRIEHLLDRSPRRLSLSSRFLATTTALIVLGAFGLQSVSPVLGFDGGPTGLELPAGIVAATDCALRPDHGIIYHGFSPRFVTAQTRRDFARFRPHYEPPALPVLDAATIAKRLGAGNVALVDLTVSADRTATVRLVSKAHTPNMQRGLSNLVRLADFEPAAKGCVAYTSTIRTAVGVSAPGWTASSVVSPEYPAGWSVAHPGSCKIPNLVHNGVPQFPERAKHGMHVGETRNVAVRVVVDRTGKVVTSTTLGQPTPFDTAVLRASVRRYPLTEESGFKPMRPAGAPIAWNRAHGSATYVGCTQPPSYVWSSLFEETVAYGMPGTTARPLMLVDDIRPRVR